MKLPEILLENFEMILEGQQNEIYRLDPYKSLIVCTDKKNKIRAKYCMVNNQFVPVQKYDKLTEESELIHTFKYERRYHRQD